MCNTFFYNNNWTKLSFFFSYKMCFLYILQLIHYITAVDTVMRTDNWLIPFIAS